MPRVAPRLPARALALVAATALCGAAACRSTAPAGPPTDEADLAGRLDRLFADALPPREPGAAVVVAREGRPILRRGYGLANVELGLAARPEMIFRIGSVTKQFTAAAALRLEERGRLRLDDRVERWLPDYPGPGRLATIEQLLRHTSGIRNYTELESWRERQTLDLTVPELIDLFDDEPLDFEPGTRFHYSNSGYVLVGAVLERVTGRTYWEILYEELLRPAGLLHTLYGSNAPVIPGRVPGYERRDGLVVNAPFLSMTHPYAAGALVSSVDDLLQWDEALIGGVLLSPESVGRMGTPSRLAGGRSVGYGLGWGVSEYEGRVVLEHGGGIHGFQAYVLRMPADRVYVAVLANGGSGAPPLSNLARRAAALAIGLPVPEGPEWLDPTDDPSAEAVGTYAGEDARGEAYEVELVLDETGLVLVARGRRHRLMRVHAGEWAVHDSTARLRLDRNAAGGVTGLRVIDWGGENIAARQGTPPPGPRD